MDPITMYGIQTAANAAGGALQQWRQKQLMGLQQKNQMELNRQGQELQMQTWEETNYPAQMAMMKAAGLNPGLMYGKGGAGGQTGGQTGGAAASGQAPQRVTMNIAELSQIKQLESATKLNEANATKADAERKEIEARTPTYGASIDKTYAEIEALIAQTGNTNAQKALTEANTEWQKIQNEVGSRTLEDVVKSVQYSNIKLMNDIIEGDARAKVAKETTDTTIAQIKANAVKQTMEIALLKEGIAKTKEEAQKIISERNLVDTEKFQSWQKLDQRDREIEIAKYEADIANEWAEFGTGATAQMALLTGSIGNLIKGVTPMMGGGAPKAVKGFGR